VPEEIHIVTGEVIDTGQSGRQVIAGAYGPRAGFGGGTLSGRDFGTPERGGAILARRLAKAVVLTGTAHACTAMLACFPGQEHVRLLALCDEAGRMLPVNRWSALADLSLAGCRERWSGRTDLIEVARHGLFSDPSLPWEVIHLDVRPGLR
jgi:hypothetical protein